MKKTIAILGLVAILGMVSCKIDKKRTNTTTKVSGKIEASAEEKASDKAEKLVEETINAHGGELYENAFYGFTFRDKAYTFNNKKGSFTYTMESKEGNSKILDELKNGKLTRTINGTKTELSQKDVAKYSEALNSVVYFATLPHKLKDRAVNKVYKGQTLINGQNYDVLQVTFEQEGGGVDHEDAFMYWIDTDTKTVDYLAYAYETNDGGVRFRSAYNPRTVAGIRFQDYVNYEAAIGTPLENLPALYEKGKLKELSRIKTENVVNLKELHNDLD